MRVSIHPARTHCQSVCWAFFFSVSRGRPPDPPLQAWLAGGEEARGPACISGLGRLLTEMIFAPAGKASQVNDNGLAASRALRPHAKKII